MSTNHIPLFWIFCLETNNPKPEKASGPNPHWMISTRLGNYLKFLYNMKWKLSCHIISLFADTRNLSNLLLAIPLGLYYIYFLPTCGTSSTYRSAIHSLKSLMILSLCCLWLDHTLLEADLMLLRSPTIHHNPPKFAFLRCLIWSHKFRFKLSSQGE